MNILITGGAGFIGSCFVDKAISHNHNVIVLDLLTYAANKNNVNDKAKLIVGDINDRQLVGRLLRDNNIAAVINFAAESHVDNSINASDVFITTNINGTHSLLEESRLYWQQSQPKNFRYIQISTDEVFGDLELDSPDKFSETTPYQPSSPYSASKAAGDHLTRAWFRTYGLPTIVTNCSNNYGPRQFSEKLIPHMISCALQGKNLPVYGDGKNVRDWIHVADHCDGVYLALTKGVPGESYCFGGDAEKSNIELVHQLCAILDKLSPRETAYKSLINFVTDRAGHDRRYAINDNKAQQQLGFTRQYDFNTGLADTIRWYLTKEQT